VGETHHGSGASRARSRLRRLVAPALFGILGTAILLALGLWQVQRLAWKEGLIAEIEARIAADPVPLPAAPDPTRDRLLRVSVTGRLGTPEIDVLTSLDPWGAGYRVIVPMTLAEGAEGRRILVDLGYVPQEMKDPADRPGPLGAGPDSPPVEVTGLLLWPRETDRFTPAPDRGRNIWFARDVAAMAAELGTEPVLVVAQSNGSAEWPKPAPPGTDLPNRHLEYAITWFGLAAVWAGMTIFWIRTERRNRLGGPR
jgi:surfeit locus 1 family protein